MIQKLIIFLVLPFNLICAQDQIQLGNEYFIQGELAKAKDIYEELAKDSQNIHLIAGNYISILKSNKEYVEAEKFLQKAIKDFPSNLQYQSKLAGIYNEYGDINKLSNYIKKIRKNAKKNSLLLSKLAQHLVTERLYNESIIFFKDARTSMNNPTVYALELASVYSLTSNQSAMIEEYLNYASNSPNRLNYVKNLLQNFIQEEKELLELEKTLIRKIQDHPENINFSELLLWVELQRQNFYGAFVQARSIDKRNNHPGDRSMSIGKMALTHNVYDDAEEIFQYVAKQYPEARNYQYARKFWMKAKENRIKSSYPIDSTKVRELANEYQVLYEELQQTQTGLEALRSKALLHAFYLYEIDSAALLLNQIIENRLGNTQFISQSKLDLGDIYLLKEEPWEATLLYSQVEKSHKSHELGYNAKLRNARLHYFIGNFTLSKAHLDILKRNTTREIANDALALGMLITDNTALDTTDAVMQEFANIELLIFQNKKKEANKHLTQMLDQYKDHSIIDEIFWLKSKLELEAGNIQGSIDNLNQILDNFSYDILADDAAFYKADIYEKQLKKVEEAKNLYQQFLIDYPGSMYVAEARKRFRQLRGDFVN